MAILYRHKLLAFTGLCLLLSLKTNANSLSVTESIEPSTTKPSEMSSTEEVLSLSPTPSPTPSPPGHGFSEIQILKSNCLYIEIANLSVNFASTAFKDRNFTSRQLNATYHHYGDNFTGCDDPKTHSSGNLIHDVMRSYYNSSNDTQFWILFQFQKKSSSDDWELVLLKHGWPNLSDSLFTYDECGHQLRAATGLTYKCGKLTCSGYESLYTNVTSVLQMEHIKVQAFLDGVKIPEMSVTCGQSADDNHTVYIIVGLVVGITILTAAVVIIGSFLYKHYKYGPYNLLD